MTVLFADAMGFTPISERLDEEEVYTLMQGCVAPHDGRGAPIRGDDHDSSLGDGVMALFGAPIAHEDSARRAVAAALDMQRSLDRVRGGGRGEHTIECRFRVGLNTGPWSSASIGDNLDMDYTAIGDTINIASRMESAAEPGTVYLSETTRRAVKDYFEFEALGELAVKGKGEPVVGVQGAARRSRRSARGFEAAGERGLTPLIGRQQELATACTEYFEQAKSGRGQVVFISGEAGIGKSRLLLEFRRSSATRVRVARGALHLLRAEHPLLPDHRLDQAAGSAIEEGDDGRQHHRACGRGHGPLGRGRRRQRAPTSSTCSTWTRATRRCSRWTRWSAAPGIFDALRALAVQNSAADAAVIVVEDLHWVDETSQEALGARGGRDRLGARS